MSAPTTDQLLDLLARTTDEGWLTPLLQDTDSRAALTAIAAIGQRVGLAVDRCCSAGLISLASLGSPGTTTITGTRTGGLASTLLKNTQFQDSRGAMYLLQQDVLFPAGPSSLPLVALSVRLTESVNTVNEPPMSFFPAYGVAAATFATPIQITTMIKHAYLTGQRVRINGVLGNTAANGFFTITVLNDTQFTLNGSVGIAAYTGGGIVQPAPFDISIVTATPVEGGAVDWLSVLARERGQRRQAGELADDFRARVRNIEDIVSPNAISVIVSGVLQRFGVPTFALKEPFFLGEAAADRAAIFLESFGQSFGDDPFNGYLDNPNRDMISRREATAYFEVDVTQPINLLTVSAFFDSPAAFLDYSFADAVDFTALSAMTQAMRDELDIKKAGGVQYDILIDLLTVLLGQGTRVAVGDATVFTLTPPAGKVWALYDCFMGVSVPNATAVAGPLSSHLHFTFDDASTFDLPTQTLYSPPELEFGSVHFIMSQLIALAFPFKPIVSITGVASSDGVNTMRLVASFWVVEITL
jgi:hypothetical protein